MKKIIYGTLATGVVALGGWGAWHKSRPANPPKLERVDSYSPARAKEKAVLVAEVAKQAIDIAGELKQLPSLSKEQVEGKIQEIDLRLVKERWVERSNGGELSAAELSELKKILQLRNAYFEQKIRFALQES